MSLSTSAATILAALIGIPPALLLGWRTRHAKQQALEKLVAAAVQTADRNHKDEIARLGIQHQKDVEWLQGQIAYYQQMSAPKRAQRPDHPPASQT